MSWQTVWGYTKRLRELDCCQQSFDPSTGVHDLSLFRVFSVTFSFLVQSGLREKFLVKHLVIQLKGLVDLYRQKGVNF